MKSDAQFTSMLSDNIFQLHATGNLISDRSQVEASNKVKDTLRDLVIDTRRMNLINSFKDLLSEGIKLLIATL